MGFHLDFKMLECFWKGKMMFHLDDHSVHDRLIHVCFDWIANALLLQNDGRLAKPLVPRICFTDRAADMLTRLTGHQKICTNRPQAVTQFGYNACYADTESRGEKLCYRGGNKKNGEQHSIVCFHGNRRQELLL